MNIQLNMALATMPTLLYPEASLNDYYASYKNTNVSGYPMLQQQTNRNE
ncbi:MAG TPA: hypothetical protein VJ720_07600 [Chitinophaga sp.]|nr:hypothetical protein [Chitinophaga sp.]